jgi:hypothetical protein
MTQAQINQEFEKKIRRGIFRPVARRLTNMVTVEDRTDGWTGTGERFRRFRMAFAFFPANRATIRFRLSPARDENLKPPKPLPRSLPFCIP